MSYTPFANLTDDEFTSHLAQKDLPTDEEIEAMLRIERLQEENAELLERLGVRQRKPETMYVHA